MDATKIIMLLGGATGLLCATAITLAASASANESREDAIAARALTAHNAERDRLRLPRLRWSRKLEGDAMRWAQHLSRQGRLQHADQGSRNDAGENLWMGSAGHWPVERMVGMFIDEKRHYRHDAFPHISHTGNWTDAGHYTQIVWRDTQEVGCAVVTAEGNDVLVCRYWPAGNIWGQKPY